MTRPMFVVATALLMLGGCVAPMSTNPLVPPEEAKLPTELMGKYEWQDSNEVVQQFEFHQPTIPCPHGVFAITGMPSAPSDEAKTLLVFSERLGDHHMVHVPVKRSAKDPAELEMQEGADRWEPDRIAGYVLVRIRLQDGELSLSSLDHQLLAEAIEAGEIQGEVERKVARNAQRISKLRLTASPADLRAFLLARQATPLFARVEFTAKKLPKPTP